MCQCCASVTISPFSLHHSHAHSLDSMMMPYAFEKLTEMGLKFIIRIEILFAATVI
jgi:hypothetical protein